MKPILIAVSLLAVSASAQTSHSASITYGAVEITAGSDVDIRRQVAEQDCAFEAATPPRGTARTHGLYHAAALRACLYRKGFFDEGLQAYPVPLFGTYSVRD